MNQPPILTGIQIQQQFSLRYGVNFLAASSGAGWQYSGSGIYSNGEILSYYYNDSPSNGDHLLVSRVPKVIAKHEEKKSSIAAPPALLEYIPPNITEFSVVPNSTYEIASTHANYLFCSASLTSRAEASGGGRMALVAYSGYYFSAYYEQLCALVVCRPSGTCYDPRWLSTGIFDDSIALASVQVRAVGGATGMTVSALLLKENGQPLLSPHTLLSNVATLDTNLTILTIQRGSNVMGTSIFGVYLQ